MSFLKHFIWIINPFDFAILIGCLLLYFLFIFKRLFCNIHSKMNIVLKHHSFIMTTDVNLIPRGSFVQSPGSVSTVPGVQMFCGIICPDFFKTPPPPQKKKRKKYQAPFYIYYATRKKTQFQGLSPRISLNHILVHNYVLFRCI